MAEKHFREYYNVDTISQNKGWKKLRELLDDNDVTLDFTGINVIEPWNCAEFKQLLYTTNVKLKFTNKEALVNHMKMMCIIDGVDPERIINVEVPVPVVETAEMKKIKNIGRELADGVIVKDDVGHFELYKRYTQISNSITLNYVEEAIRVCVEEKGLNKFILETGKLRVNSNVLDFLATIIVRLRAKDIILSIDTESEDVQKEMSLYIHKATSKQYTDDDKIEIIKNKLKEGTAGILIKYRKSKAVDDFGRHGKGQIVSARIAIFKGLEYYEDEENTVRAKFISFNKNKFYTRQHWMVEHDNQIPNSLYGETEIVSMEQLGYGDIFLGSQYHFIMPVQRTAEEDEVVITGLTDTGSNIKEKCSIPRRMQLVFDDWCINYNKEELEKAIKETNRLLGRE